MKYELIIDDEQRKVLMSALAAFAESDDAEATAAREIFDMLDAAEADGVCNDLTL